jgi:hypothetical protein
MVMIFCLPSLKNKLQVDDYFSSPVHTHVHTHAHMLTHMHTILSRFSHSRRIFYMPFFNVVFMMSFWWSAMQVWRCYFLFVLQVTTHQEVTDTSFLSNLACLIPMPDCNQSPRNMYQCQVSKFSHKYWLKVFENKALLRLKGDD